MSFAHALGQFRHLYKQLFDENVKDQKHCAMFLTSPAIQDMELHQEMLNELERRTRPNGDMADLAVNTFVKEMLR